MEIKKHTGNKQPASTRGKVVQYRTHDVYGSGGEIIATGIWHHRAPADELNWKTNGSGTPAIGRIESFIIA